MRQGRLNLTQVSFDADPRQFLRNFDGTGFLYPYYLLPDNKKALRLRRKALFKIIIGFLHPLT
jgi:hypothetical protein